MSLHAATATEYATQARAALNRRNFDKAVELAEKAIELEPKNAEHHYLLGAAYGELAQKAGKLGLIQEKQGKKAEAKASYANALKIVPGDKGLIEALKRVS